MRRPACPPRPIDAAPPTPARTAARRARPLLALLLALAPFAPAQGAQEATDPALAALVAAHPVWGPALAYRSPATDAALRALDAASAEAARVDLGLAASLTLTPSVAWRGATGAEPASAAWRADLTAAVGYRHDPLAIARARRDLHGATVAGIERAHRDLRDALSLHVDLQRAHLALAAAEAAAARRAEELADAEAAELGRDPAAPPSTTLAAAQLAQERAASEVDRAARAVAEAARRAVAAGFDAADAERRHRDRFAPLPLEGWRLWWPASGPGASPAVARAELDLAVAEAALAAASWGEVVDDVALDVAYALPDLRLRATLDLDEGRPGAAFDATLRPGGRPSWSIGIGARLQVDDRTTAAWRAAQDDVDRARAALADARAEAPWALEAAHRAALDAEADVAFAERALALGRIALAEAVERWRAADAATRARADAALARTAAGFDRERDAFYRAWNAYALAVERVLVVAGASGGVLAPD